MDAAFSATVPYLYHATAYHGCRGPFLIRSDRMEQQQKETAKVTPEVAAKNRRLAIILAVVAVVFYLGFILAHMK